MVPTFSDQQIFPTFPVFIFQYFFPFPVCFLVFHLMNLTNTTICLTNTLQLKKREKIKIKTSQNPFTLLVFWGKIPRLSSLFKIP